MNQLEKDGIAIMSASLNKVVLIGNLGKDPEVRISQEGSKVVTLSIATSEQWKDKATGERKERVEWHRVVIFNTRLAEIAERFLKKGLKVYIEGQLQTRKWTDQQNQEHRIQEIVIRYRGEVFMIDSRDSSGYQNEINGADSAQPADDDRIPF